MMAGEAEYYLRKLGDGKVEEKEVGQGWRS